MNRHRNAGRPARAPRGGGRGIGLGFFRALALLIFLVSSGMPTRAAEAPPPEAAKAAALKSVLEGRAFKLYAGDDPVVCLPLLDTLRAGGEAVAFVEPIVRAERYHDPALAPYRAMCPGMELNKESIGTGHSLSLSLTCRTRSNITSSCIAPGSLDTSLSHAAGLSDIAVCHA